MLLEPMYCGMFRDLPSVRDIYHIIFRLAHDCALIDFQATMTILFLHILRRAFVRLNASYSLLDKEQQPAVRTFLDWPIWG